MNEEILMVKLEDFVKEVIVQIINGVKNSQEIARANNAQVNPTRLYKTDKGALVMADSHGFGIPQEIEFDIAISAVEKSDTKGGAGVFISAIGLGLQLGEGAEKRSTSRVKFSVPIVFPSQKE